MLILGIETSCDETAAAVVENGCRVRSNVIASQIALHAKTGGVVPEVAAREHAVKILPVLDRTLEEAGVAFDEIEAIAVTSRPGLISSLLIGTNTAATLALLGHKKLIPVNHIEGHIYANWLEREEAVEFPIVILTVSGGHNELVLMKDHGVFEILGSTLDDAAGEAFDKVARLLELPYPGGPHLSKLAQTGNPRAYDLPRALMGQGSDGRNYHFSFSGLKSSVSRLIEQEGTRLRREDLAASFQEAVVDVLSAKLVRAAQDHGTKEAHLAGGVSANTRLREITRERLNKANLNLKFRFPQELIFCTDNAAMIASAGYFHYKKSPEKYSEWCNIRASSQIHEA